MPDHFTQVPELLGKLTPCVMQGKIKHRAHVLEGLESAIDGLNLLFTGGNKGKLIVKLERLSLPACSQQDARLALAYKSLARALRPPLTLGLS